MNACISGLGGKATVSPAPGGVDPGATLMFDLTLEAPESGAPKILGSSTSSGLLHATGGA